MGHRIIVVGVFLMACGHQPVQVTLSPEVCPAPPHIGHEPEPVCYAALECQEAQKKLEIRNAKLEQRMDECEAKGNDYVDCTHWVFGYLPEDRLW